MYDFISAKANFVGGNTEMPYTVLIGVAAVFAVLICIIILCKVIGLLCGNAKKAEKQQKVEKVNAAPVAATAQPIENRQQIIAAVSAAVAEELGTDVSAIRILSFKKI